MDLIISDNHQAKGLNFATQFKIKKRIFGYKSVKITKFFTKEFKPYVIGKITTGKNKVKLNGKIDWS